MRAKASFIRIYFEKLYLQVKMVDRQCR